MTVDVMKYSFFDSDSVVVFIPILRIMMFPLFKFICG